MVPDISNKENDMETPGHNSQSGASLLSVLVGAAIILTVGLVINRSLLTNLRMSTGLEHNKTYKEVDEAFRQSLVRRASQSIKQQGKRCSVPKDMFKKVDILPGTMYMKHKTNFKTRAFTKKKPPDLNNGKHRCKTQTNKYPTKPNNSAQNRYYFCVELLLENDQARDNLSIGAPLKTKLSRNAGEGAYAEVTLELQHGHTFSPISCRQFQKSSKHGIKVHYSIHWLAPDPKNNNKNIWFRKNGVFYSQKSL